MSKKILIADKLDDDVVKGLSQNGHDVSYEPNLTQEELDKKIGEYEIAIIRATIVANQPKLATIRAGAGVNNIQNQDKYTEEGKIICNTPGDGTIHKGNSNSVAEAVIGTIYLIGLDEEKRDKLTSGKYINLHPKNATEILEKIITERNLIKADQDLKDGISKKKDLYRGNEVIGGAQDNAQMADKLSIESPLAGKKLGIVGGSGAVAKLVTEYAKKLGMEVHLQGRSVTEQSAKDAGCHYAASVEELANNCDIVSLHVALVKGQTDGLIDEKIIEKLEGKTLINFARAAVVEHDAIVKALENGKIIYALDADVKEVQLLANKPGFTGYPHIGAESNQAQQNVAIQAAEIVELLDKQNIVFACNVINKGFVKNNAEIAMVEYVPVATMQKPELNIINISTKAGKQTETGLST